MDVPQRLTRSIVDLTQHESNHSKERSAPDTLEPEANIGGKVKERDEVIEVDVDDDDEIKALLVCNLRHSYLFTRV